ncbi:hypothetical protein H5U35_01740, partial [Candidatus Aerophobetes bacterium]|nr:hypothetical protein [Candidatus Aerophobetes bacterium]
MQYLYIKENKEVVHCTSFNSLNKKIYAGQICQLIDGFRYSSALEIVENSPFRGNSEILNTLRAMEKRMLFDFEGALDDARNIRDERLHFLSEELSELARKNAVYLLLELFYRIENRFKRKDYLEAVASLFSLIEFGLHYIFFLLAKHEGKIPGYFVVEKVKSEFNDYVENNPDLKNYLKKGETNYKNASQVAFRKAIGFILNKSENSEALSKIKNSVESFLKLEEEFGKEKDTDYGKISLRELRNSGPYAHSTKGINEALLGRLLSPFTVEGFVEEMVRKPIEDICGKKTDNPFLK